MPDVIKDAFSALSSIPIVGPFIAPAAGFALGGPLGAAAASGISTGFQTGNPLAGFLSGAGSLAGAGIGQGLSIGADNIFGQTLGDLASNNLGSFAGNALGDLGGTTLGSTLGSTVGSSLGEMAGNTLNPQSSDLGGTGVPGFSPSKQPQMGLPQSLSQFGNLSPDQQATNIASKGVYGGGQGADETNYFLNLMNRQLFDQNSGGAQNTNGIAPVDMSFLNQLGISGSSPTDLLKGISQYSRA